MARVLVLQDSGINESLALTELAAVLGRDGHLVRLILGDEERRPGRAIRRFEPDLVVIPCPVAGHERALADAALVKAVCPEAVVIFGGTHATFTPELAFEPAVDAVCIGEAEGAVADVAQALENSRDWRETDNLVVADGQDLVRNPLRPLVPDLDALPMPDRELYFRFGFIARLPWKKFATGRGCVHDCSFCWNTALREMTEGSGSFVRRKSPQRAVDEVLAVRARHPLRRVHFSDDLFTVHPLWLEEFAELYRDRVGVPFTCNTSVPLTTGRTVDALARAGCCGVAIGIETGNEDLRAQILGKRVTDDAIRQAGALIKDRGMELMTYNMIGAPGERPDDVLQTIALNRELGVDTLRVNLAIPLAHTSFEETAFSLGFLPGGAQGAADLRAAELQVDGGDRRALVNLYLLFRPAIHRGLPLGLVRRLAQRSPTALLQVLRLWGVHEEKRITDLRWGEGLRYFRHVGDPRRRTANYVTLI